MTDTRKVILFHSPNTRSTGALVLLEELTWTTKFELVPETPVIRAYMDRVNARPAVARVRQIDAELAAAQVPT